MASANDSQTLLLLALLRSSMKLYVPYYKECFGIARLDRCALRIRRHPLRHTGRVADAGTL